MQNFYDADQKTINESFSNLSNFIKFIETSDSTPVIKKVSVNPEPKKLGVMA